MDKNRFLIAAAGAGKTTKIVRDALSQQEGVLLVTFTDINRGEIMEKVIKEKGCIPSNITITTWFSFLIQHGVKPYQSSYHPSFENVNFSGLILCKTGHEGRIEQETPQKKKCGHLCLRRRILSNITQVRMGGCTLIDYLN